MLTLPFIRSKRHSRASSRAVPAALAGLTGLFVLGAVTILMLLHGPASVPAPGPVLTATPAQPYQAFARQGRQVEAVMGAKAGALEAAPAALPPTATPAVLPVTPTSAPDPALDPAPSLTATATTAPEQALLPDGPAQAGAGEGGQQGQPGQSSMALTPTVVNPAPKQKPGEIILPNGVRYGDPRPNLPHRVVRIAAPAIKLDASVYEVYVKNGAWEVAEYAAGHHYNSPNPGEGGNIVISGHNNWKGEVFRYLEFLKPGDEIDLWTLEGKQYKYVVQEIMKLKEAGVSYQQRLRNAQVMNPTPYEQLTLITCWPYTTYTHRLVVIAKPAP